MSCNGPVSLTIGLQRHLSKSWDKAVFASELVNLNIVLPVDPEKVGQKHAHESNVGDGQVQEGAYSGTQLALTEMYDRIVRG